MNGERKDILNGARIPHTRSDVPGEGVRNETGFIDEKQLLARLPISRRTLGNWKVGGIIPFIKIGSRCLYDWPNVHGALLRRREAGNEELTRITPRVIVSAHDTQLCVPRD